ncbi:hypothetical protein CDQ83_08865 [Clostridium thermosuccinogenes]|nr:hypothetical protein CDO33_04060 [Pseudoclostridium thermosuccinogenes]PNT93591.1 hypothetical protein CDQ83_08865 [Pseudoclostridium thermosuccinogenes]
MLTRQFIRKHIKQGAISQNINIACYMGKLMGLNFHGIKLSWNYIFMELILDDASNDFCLQQKLF